MKLIKKINHSGDDYEIWGMGTGSRYLRRVNREALVKSLIPNPWVKMGHN